MKHLSILIIALYSVGISVLIFLLTFPLYFNYQQYKKNNPNIQAKDYIAKIGKLVNLPENEGPEVGIIIDKAKLKNDPFFDEAQKGDIILIYPQAEEAILYNPRSNKIIKIGPYIEKPMPTAGPALNTGSLNSPLFIKPLDSTPPTKTP